jgi:hypothetical protein
MFKLVLLALVLCVSPALLAQSTALAAPLQLPASSIPAGANDANVFGFTLTRDSVSPLTPVIFSGLTVTNGGTAAGIDYTQLKLYAFSIGPTGVTQTLVATAASPSLSFSGFNRLLLPDVQSIFVVAVDIPASAQNGATFALALANAGVTVSNSSVSGGPIQGETHTINNTGVLPVIEVRDAADAVIAGGIASAYDLQAAQGDTALSGQVYTFTVRNTGTGTLSLSGTPAVLAAPINNCVVTAGVPSSTSIGAGGSATFTLNITPTAVGAYSLGVTIFNNSATNPFLFAVNGVGSVVTATQLAIATQPGGGKAGSPLSPQPVVEARDGSGGLDATYNGLVVATVSVGPGVVVAGGAAQCVNGVATFTGLAVNTAGTGYQIEFTSAALTPVLSATFDVSAAGGNNGNGGDGGGDEGSCSANPGGSWSVLALMVIAMGAATLRRLRAA